MAGQGVELDGMEINPPSEENIYRFHSRTSPLSRMDGNQRFNLDSG